MAARLPEEVGAQVVLARPHVRAGNEAAALALRAVGLDAERIDDEDEGAIALVERVEVDLDVVVAADAVAIGERRGDGPGVGERADAEVHGVRRVPDAHVGGIGRGPPVGGRVEGEAVEDRGVRPDGLVEPAVDGDGRLDPGQRNVGLAELAVVDAGVAEDLNGGELEGGEEGEQHREKASRSRSWSRRRASQPGPEANRWSKPSSNT